MFFTNRVFCIATHTNTREAWRMGSYLTTAVPAPGECPPAPNKYAATGVPKNTFALGPGIEKRAMAVWEGRIAFGGAGGVSVFDLAGVRLYTFSTDGFCPGEHATPVDLRAHPNGNLLVRVRPNRIHEVTWTGEHVRFICGVDTNGWSAGGIDVSPDRSLLAVRSFGETAMVELLDERTCAAVTRLGSPKMTIGQSDVRFSPDGNRLVTVGPEHKPTMFDLHKKGTGTADGAESATNIGTEFGVMSASAVLHEHVEFTDDGDVVVAAYRGATVYSGTTLEPVRSWAWPSNVDWVYAIQAYRGLLYVLCRTDRNSFEVHVYE